jgi:hypothetical protein
MLIRSGLETDIIALFSFITGDTVCQHDLIRVADMRFAGRICDRSRDIVWFFTITILILTHEPIPPEKSYKNTIIQKLYHTTQKNSTYLTLLKTLASFGIMNPIAFIKYIYVEYNG